MVKKSSITYTALRPSKVNQGQTQHHQHQAKSSQRAVRRYDYFPHPDFHPFGKRKIRQPLDNHYHSNYTQKKFHWLLSPNPPRIKFIPLFCYQIKLIYIVRYGLFCQNKSEALNTQKLSDY